MKRFRKYFRRTYYLGNQKRQNKLLSVLIVQVLLLIALHAYFTGSAWGIQRYYRHRLTVLEDFSNNLPKILSESSASDVNQNFKTYDATLKRPLEACQQLNQKHKQIGKSKLPKELSSTIGKSRKLCDDLIPLIQYSRQLYTHLALYLKQDLANWPAVESELFAGRIAETQGLLRSTSTMLAKIDTSKVDDPALDELKSQLNSAQKLADDSYLSLTKGDAVQAQTLSTQLVGDMDQDKADFLNARSYFWNNTVQLADLKQAIVTLNDQLN